LHHRLKLSFLTSEFFYRKQPESPPPTPYSPDWTPSNFFPRLKRNQFDTNEEIEAESQAVLNRLTEHDFQDAFKK
jgi:hypothetical protein